MKTIIEHSPTGKEFESNDRIVKCPFGKNRKVKSTDSIDIEVCDSCQDNLGGHEDSQERVNRCYYEKR